eukprot:323103_1
METNARLWFLVNLLVFHQYMVTFVDSLCSSINYSNNIRNILSSQTDYNLYEGKLIFRQNASYLGGANPSGIYGVPYFENIDNITNPMSTAPHATYYLRSSNLLIFAGCTPPKSIYFSFLSYIFDRYNDYQNNTNDRGVKWLYASLGAALNNLVWHTSTSATNISLNYDSLTTVIATGDNVTYNQIYSLLINSGISSNEINLQTLPNEYIKWLPYKYNTNNINQYNKSYDTGSFLLRVALTDNHTEYQEYIHTNQTIFI